jgi:hypothetical protein
MGWLSVECPFELRFDIDSTHDGELAMYGGAAQGGGETGVATVHATKGDDVWAIGRFINSFIGINITAELGLTAIASLRLWQR